MPATPDRSIDDTRASSRREERRLQRPSRMSESTGIFDIDETKVPPGFVMEWKRHSTMGAEDRRNQVVVRQNHWSPVPHKMQDQIMGHLCKDPEQQIEVDGLALYMRPKYLNDDALAEQQEETAYVLDQQVRSLRMNSEEQVGKRFTKIKKAVVQAQVVE